MGRLGVLAMLIMSGCFGFGIPGTGLFGMGNFRKVNIYPDKAIWDGLEGGAKKLGWKTERGDAAGWALTVSIDDDRQMRMMEDGNICAVAVDQAAGRGCAGLSFQCEKSLSADDCVKRFMQIAEAAGIDPSTLKVSNRMAHTENTGVPYQP